MKQKVAAKVWYSMFKKCLATLSFMKRTSLMLCNAAMCFHHSHLSPLNQQLQNLQINFPLGVEVSSEAYS